MTVVLRKQRPIHRRFFLARSALQVEMLEARLQPSAPSWPGLINPVTSSQPNGTLDQALGLGDLTAAQQLPVVGNIPAGSANVDWYSFTLDNPADVRLTTLDVQAHSSFISELSLYNTDFDPTNDPYVPTGFRLLSQDDGANHGGDASIERLLAPGTYYVAVSGSGNRYFHPDIADSGIAGSSGAYGLLITGQDLGLGATNGPVVMATDLLTYPGFTPFASNPNGTGIVPQAIIGRSPFIIRVDVSEALDPTTITPGQTVQLTDITNGQPVPVTAYFDASANELKLTPAAPLLPDEYQLTLSGNNSSGAAVIQDLAGNPLGASTLNPTGQDYTFTFQVTGSEGIASTPAVSDGTPASAHELGDIGQAGLVQMVGAIGDDPTDPIPFNPADVDLYHFHLSGSDHFAFRAEVFAGRIGSPLDSEVSLFRLDPADGQLHLVGLNDNTGNATLTFDGSQQPLKTDSSLTMALTAGDYYVAVTGSGYVPAALTDAGLPGPQSVFDPTVAHPFGGPTTGDYVLNLSVVADNTPPRVTSLSVNDNMPLIDGAVLSGPPTGFSVGFSEPVNLPQLAQQAFQAYGDTKLDSVYVVGPQGTYYPHFWTYANDGASADFHMYDPLPNGTYQLHLSGPKGLTDLAGNALVGNSPGGDYVVSFTVYGPARGSPADPLTWIVKDQQNIGILFPNELQTGVTLQRPPVPGSTSAPGGNETYQVQVLENKLYTFALSSTAPTAGVQLTVTNSLGSIVKGRITRSANSVILVAVLTSGTYTIQVSGWSPQAGFAVKVSIVLAMEPAPPLSIGAGPAVPLRGLAGVLPPPPATTTTTTNTGPAATPNPAIVPVSLVSPTSNALPTDPGSVPSGILLSLAAGPLGGIPGANTGQADVYDRLIALAPDPSLTQLIVSLPVLTQVSSSGLSQTAETTIVGSVLQEIVGALNKLNWQTVTEFLRRMEERAGDPTMPNPPDEDDATPEIDAWTSPDVPGLTCWPTSGNINSGSNAGMQALVLAAALAAVDVRDRRGSRKPHSPRKRIPEHCSKN